MELPTEATGVGDGVGVGRVTRIGPTTGIFLSTGRVIAGGWDASEASSESCPVGADVGRVASSKNPTMDMITTGAAAAT
jgi:hypothetical protein